MEEKHFYNYKFQLCQYSCRLMFKLLHLNKLVKHKVNLEEIKKAIYYAKKYHGNQKRQTGEPYYSHPLEVAYMVADYCFSTDILVVSILHDVIEDTDLTKEKLSHIFSPDIADQVDALTRKVCNNKKISAADIVVSLWQQKRYDLLLIKYFDRLHNMQTIYGKPKEKIFKTTYETLKNFTSLSIFFKTEIPDLSEIDKTIFMLCYQQLISKHSALPNLNLVCQDTFQLPFLNFHNALPQTKSLLSKEEKL